MSRAWLAVLLALAALATTAHAQAPPSNVVTLRAAEVFQVAEAAERSGDNATAEKAYLALIQDQDLEIRTEARFRLARLYAGALGRPRDAAVLLRRILDDKPDAAPVRLELARVLAMLGETQAASRELRAVQASRLPEEVANQVRFFANALTATRRSGGGLSLALAPSSNVNSATRADTLGTVIGDLALSEEAQAQSGVGASVKAHVFSRLAWSADADLLLRLGAAADLYQASQFDDVGLSLQVGPQWRSAQGRFQLASATDWRWYGGQPYSLSYGLTGAWQRPLGPRNQLRLDLAALRTEYRQNAAQTGERYTTAIGLDRAFSARSGGGLQLHHSRDRARDPGYSTTSRGLSTYAYREFGRTTAVLTAAYRRLDADARLALFPARRQDENLNLGFSGTFRALTLGTFAPVVGARYERNTSTVGLYDFDRLSAEFGFTGAF